MTTKRWEHFEHQADIGVRGIGVTPQEAFEQAALAMTAVVTDPSSVVPRQMLEVVCRAPDYELLLIEWLNRLIFEMATRRMLFSRFDIDLALPELRARIGGEPIDVERHKPVVEVKAATYHELKVARNDSGLWIAQCVIDV